MEEKLDIYDEKLLQRMLFSNYECYEILGTEKVLLLNLDSKNDKCQEKNIIFDKKTKEYSFGKQNQGFGELEFNEQVNRVFLKKQTNIFYFKNEDYIEIYKTNTKKQLSLITKIQTRSNSINYMRNGFANKIISNDNFDFCKFTNRRKDEYCTLLINTKITDNILNDYSSFSLSEYEEDNTVYKVSNNIRVFTKEKILIAFKEDLLKDNFTIKIFTENNFFNKTINIGKTFKSSKIKHLEINGNLLSIFVFVKKNEYKKFFINLLNGKEYIEKKDKITNILEIKHLYKVVEKIETKDMIYFKYCNKVFFKIKKTNFSHTTEEVDSIKIYLNSNYYFLYNFDFGIKKILTKKQNYFSQFVRENEEEYPSKVILIDDTIHIKYKNYKNSELKLNDINFFQTKCNFKNLFCFTNNDKSFLIYDVKTKKILFNKYYFLESNKQDQLKIFLKQTNFQRAKTNILNKTQFEK